MMKISIITNILVLRFYEYIRDTSTNILIQNISDVKTNKNSKILRKTFFKNYIRSKNKHFKVIF